MKSSWDADLAKATVDSYVAQGVNEDLAIRTYTTRLLGQDPQLVLHGGGNTSVKTVFTDEDGTEVEVMCVKGSGWDMATIEPQGLPAVRLGPLQKIAEFERLSDEKMVALQRRQLLDPAAPNPSVEAILHAILPFKHVDHTHANAIVALTNQPNGEDIIREIYPDAVLVTYVMPGFELAKVCLRTLQGQPNGDAMILLNHGIFTYSDDPRQAYENMIALVDRAERKLAKGNERPFRGIELPDDLANVSEVAPIIRGALACDSGADEMPKRWVLEHRADDAILRFCNGETIEDYATKGNATPDHILRIKRAGIPLPPPTKLTLDKFANTVRSSVEQFAQDYDAYFKRNNERVGGTKVMLDPMPRVFYVAGLGLFAAGKTKKDAKVAADIAEATIEVITKAEGIGTFTALSEEDLFDVEYWSLEQAKLSKAVEKPLTRQVAVVTGAAGGLGYAISAALRSDGAEVAMLDIDGEKLAAAATELGAFAVCCDVTKLDAVDAAIARTVEQFGGVDILISNAGAAFQGRLLEVGDETFQQAFALNFWSHHYVARACVKVMETMGTGGALVFNVSKQAVNPGPDFGPYGTSKAALMALMRQYAVEYGVAGITANAVNADRIRTGLLTDEFIAERSVARGVSPEDYMRGNLLKREVSAQDVADAFVYLAKARKSTGAVITVDGGNVAAMMR